MNGYLGAMRRYASFGGRASRAEFWWFTLLASAVIFIALIVDTAYISGPSSESQPFAGVVVLLHILPSLAVTARRLHDTDRSGWLLLVSVIPLIGTIVLIVWSLQAGTSGANRFGRDPYGRPSSPNPHGFAPAMPTLPASRDVIADIERLAQLRANGSLSDAEYEVMKAQALGQGGRA